MRRTWLLALVALAACSRGGPTNAPAPANATNAAANSAAAAPPAGPPSARLAQVFTPDMLGANVAYLETITGPAFKTEGATRIYKLDGCTVIVGAAKSRIENLGIQGYGGRCSFPIAQYFAGGYDHPVPNLPTFADIQAGLGGDYGADCLTLCGNAADPVVSLTYHGSHADNFNDLVAEVSIGDDATLTPPVADRKVLHLGVCRLGAMEVETAPAALAVDDACFRIAARAAHGERLAVEIQIPVAVAGEHTVGQHHLITGYRGCVDGGLDGRILAGNVHRPGYAQCHFHAPRAVDDRGVGHRQHR